MFDHFSTLCMRGLNHFDHTTSTFLRQFLTNFTLLLLGYFVSFVTIFESLQKIVKVFNQDFIVARRLETKIRQKCESRNGCFKKTKHAKFSEKTNISYPPDTHTCTCAYQAVRNNRFSENLTYFVFLKHPFWASPFCLITNDWR